MKHDVKRYNNNVNFIHDCKNVQRTDTSFR